MNVGLQLQKNKQELRLPQADRVPENRRYCFNKRLPAVEEDAGKGPHRDSKSTRLCTIPCRGLQSKKSHLKKHASSLPLSSSPASPLSSLSASPPPHPSAFIIFLPSTHFLLFLTLFPHLYSSSLPLLIAHTYTHTLKKTLLPSNPPVFYAPCVKLFALCPERTDRGTEAPERERE